MKEYSYKFKTRIERLGDIGPVFCRPENVTEWLRGKAWEAEEDWKEHCVAVFTNKANRVIGFETISVGTQDKCILDPKPICRTAIDILADGIIIIHNLA